LQKYLNYGPGLVNANLGRSQFLDGRNPSSFITNDLESANEGPHTTLSTGITGIINGTQLEVWSSPWDGAFGVNGPKYVLFDQDKALSINFGANFVYGVGFYLTDFMEGCTNYEIPVRLSSNGQEIYYDYLPEALSQPNGTAAYLGLEFPTPFNKVTIEPFCNELPGRMGLDELTVIVA
jgi:hypothetical protein